MEINYHYLMVKMATFNHLVQFSFFDVHRFLAVSGTGLNHWWQLYNTLRAIAPERTVGCRWDGGGPGETEPTARRNGRQSIWKFLKIPPDPKLKRCKPMVLGMLHVRPCEKDIKRPHMYLFSFQVRKS